MTQDTRVEASHKVSSMMLTPVLQCWQKVILCRLHGRWKSYMETTTRDRMEKQVETTRTRIRRVKFERRLLGRGARRMQLQKPVRTGRQQKASEWVETRTQAEWAAERDMSFGHNSAEEKAQRVEGKGQIRSRRKRIAEKREGSTLFQLARNDFSTYDGKLTRKMARCPLSVHGWARHRAEQVKADKKDWLALLPELDTEKEKISEAALAACGRLAATEALFVRSWERQQHPQDQGASARTDARRAKVVREAARLAISRRQLQGLVVTVNQVILGAKVRCWTNGENADNKWVKRWARVSGHRARVSG